MFTHGCDLVTLDADGHVVLGEPCVGGVTEDESEVAEGLLVPVARHSAEGGW